MTISGSWLTGRSILPHWAIAATQKNSDQDRFLAGLEITQWDTEQFVGSSVKKCNHDSGTRSRFHGVARRQSLSSGINRCIRCSTTTAEAWTGEAQSWSRGQGSANRPAQ